MEKADWDRLQALFEAALALPVGQRDTYLRQQAGSDAIVQDVRDLLDAHLSAANLWQTSPPEEQTRLRTDFGHTGVLEIGHVIGPLKVEEKIGIGGMGVIYRALDTRLQRQVALKFLPAHLHRDATARQRFMAEARAASGRL